MLPPASGTTAVVNKYWVVKLAVYVVATAGVVTVWESAPLSDQLAKTYLLLDGPGCGDVVVMEWLLPIIHWNVCGAVSAVPSTMIFRPAGAVVTVILASALKFTVAERAAVIDMDCGFVEPVRSPV